jgi:4-diphosphocytidyl-2-C-methyl-D-erythritol kinase
MRTESALVSGSARLRAHAKLNLSLRVLAREESGFHSIETLLVRLELADIVDLETTSEAGIRLAVTGDPAVPSDGSNLCWRAAEAIARELRASSGIRIGLAKSVPAGAGLGGGSADAAAVLLGLNRLWGNPLDHSVLARLAGELGSDVPFGLCEASMALAWERGRRLLPLAAPSSLPVLIVVPGFPISAGQAYAWLAEDRASGLSAPPAPAQIPPPVELADLSVLSHLAINDLQEPVFRRHPELSGIRDALTDRGADVALLCGSGSCVAGLFRDASVRDRAARSFGGEQGLSTISTRTLE